jgi:hypothetical protein
MTNYTIDAALAIEAGSPFPYSFPLYFGPTVEMTNSGADDTADTPLAVTISTPASVSHHQTMNASLACTVATPAAAGRDWFVDAELGVSVVNAPFPYVFPFIFEKPTDTISIGHPVSSSLAATMTPAATGTRGAIANVSQAITAAFSATMFAAAEKGCDVSQAVTASFGVTMTRNATTNASLDVVAFAYRFPYTLPFTFWEPATVDWHTYLSASMPIIADQSASTIWDGGMSSALEVSMNTTVLANLHSTMLSTLPVTAIPTSSVNHGQLMNSNLSATVEALGTIGVGFSVNCSLSVAAILEASVPGATSFWPFYIN